MNTLLSNFEKQAEFRATLDALTTQLANLMTLAYRRYPNQTETLEAISVAKYLLGKVGDQLTAAITPDPEWSDNPINLSRESLNP